MAEVNVVNDGGVRYREYQIEPGDSLSAICLRFGHPDWSTVYNLPKNAPFRARFPKPAEIDYVAAVNLFIPLVGDSATAKRKRGVRLGDFYVVRLLDEAKRPLAGIRVRLIQPPGDPHDGTEFETDANGEVSILNPKAGVHYVVSAPSRPMEFMPVAAMSQEYPPTSLGTAFSVGGLPHPMGDVPLQRSAVTEVSARKAYYIVCPMCNVSFHTVKQPPGAANLLCPNDRTNLGAIQVAIDANPSWVVTGQDPKVTPTGLATRGTDRIKTAHGEVDMYWDESRFVDPAGGDYTLWALDPSTGVALSVDVIGRATWGAKAPRLDLASILYEFHETAQDPANPPYRTFGIPSNESRRLADDVLRWITVHHSQDPPQNSVDTVRTLQTNHQTDNFFDNPAEPYADVGYHYVIDGDGKVYEGRPLGIMGSQVRLFNSGNAGVVVAGTLDTSNPTSAQLTKLDEIVRVLAFRFTIKDVAGHRDRDNQRNVANPTVCPGRNLHPHVTSVLTKQFPGPP